MIGYSRWDMWPEDYEIKWPEEEEETTQGEEVYDINDYAK